MLYAFSNVTVTIHTPLSREVFWYKYAKIKCSSHFFHLTKW